MENLDILENIFENKLILVNHLFFRCLLLMYLHLDPMKAQYISYN